MRPTEFSEGSNFNSLNYLMWIRRKYAYLGHLLMECWRHLFNRIHTILKLRIWCSGRHWKIRSWIFVPQIQAQASQFNILSEPSRKQSQSPVLISPQAGEEGSAWWHAAGGSGSTQSRPKSPDVLFFAVWPCLNKQMLAQGWTTSTSGSIWQFVLFTANKRAIFYLASLVG